jgi:tRNA-2-methylthio-N6-dimethylallyladenosine synthase
MPRRRANAVKGWVNIMYGCDEFCTYCIVPYTRGKERRRLPEDVIKEVRELAAAGYKEVTLLGQNVNAYGKDFSDREYTFGSLLADLGEIDIPRIRFTTSHPHDFDELMIATLAKRGNLMEYIHLPVQSGNNQILKRMNRRYTRESYLQLVRDLRAAIPDVAITTDIIVGFPGETEEQFQDTMSLAKEVGYDGAYTFIYSPREGTPAAKMEDNVTDKEKKDRLYRLNDLINADAMKGNARFQDQIVEVLVEGPSKNDETVMSGYTRHQKLVNFPADPSVIGQIVNVKIVEAKTWHLRGELV